MTTVLSKVSLDLVLEDFPSQASHVTCYSASDTYDHGTTSPCVDKSENLTILSSPNSDAAADDASVNWINYPLSNYKDDPFHNESSCDLYDAQKSEKITPHAGVAGATTSTIAHDTASQHSNNSNSSNLMGAIGQIVYKFDPLFPIYRLSDSDCKHLCSMVYEEFDFVDRIFCNAIGRLCEVKIYYYGSTQCNKLYFYNKQDSEKQVKSWNDVVMDDTYCLQQLGYPRDEADEAGNERGTPHVARHRSAHSYFEGKRRNSVVLGKKDELNLEAGNPFASVKYHKHKKMFSV